MGALIQSLQRMSSHDAGLLHTVSIVLALERMGPPLPPVGLGKRESTAPAEVGRHVACAACPSPSGWMAARHDAMVASYREHRDD